MSRALETTQISARAKLNVEAFSRNRALFGGQPQTYSHSAVEPKVDFKGHHAARARLSDFRLKRQPGVSRMQCGTGRKRPSRVFM